jgi:hypothetical protein
VTYWHLGPNFHDPKPRAAFLGSSSQYGSFGNRSAVIRCSHGALGRALGSFGKVEAAFLALTPTMMHDVAGTAAMQRRFQLFSMSPVPASPSTSTRRQVSSSSATPSSWLAYRTMHVDQRRSLPHTSELRHSSDLASTTQRLFMVITYCYSTVQQLPYEVYIPR